MPSNHFPSDSEVTSAAGRELDGIHQLQFPPGLHCSSVPLPVNHLLAQDTPVSHPSPGRRRRHDGHVEVKTPHGGAVKPHEASHMSAAPHVYIHLGHCTLSHRGLAAWAGPSFGSWPGLGILLGPLSLSLLRSNSPAHSWWVSLHVGWPTLTCECLFTLSFK